MKKLLLYTALPFTFCAPAAAQTMFNVDEYIDINKIKAGIQVHGDLWWKAGTEARCEFPKGSGKNAQTVSALWLSGYDGSNNLHVSAQTSGLFGNDFWPGPLDASDTVSLNASALWARVWKLDRTTLDMFLMSPVHDISNTPPVILEWPAKNNPHARGTGALAITKNMAPFADVNNDGVYNALQGDYPAMKGDQMAWWVFSDNGHTHDNAAPWAPLSKPLKVEVHASAYAYSRGTAVDNIIFYEFELINRSAENYHNFRAALFSDADLGYYRDDYLGFDSTRRMAYSYNAMNYDSDYGASMPVSGVTFVEMPGDNAGNVVPAGSFIPHVNDGSIYGNPCVDTQFNHYMRSRFLDGSHLKNDFAGPHIAAFGYTAGPDVNYIWPGDPADTDEWSECVCEHPIGDRRYVLATNDYTLPAGNSTKMAFALVITDTSAHNHCTAVNIKGIKDLADTAWRVYKNPLPVAVPGMALAQRSLTVYPNPAHSRLFIDRHGTRTTHELVQVYDAIGKRVHAKISYNKERIEIDTEHLPRGMYHILYSNDDGQRANVFVKD